MALALFARADADTHLELLAMLARAGSAARRPQCRECRAPGAGRRVRIDAASVDNAVVSDVTASTITGMPCDGRRGRGGRGRGRIGYAGSCREMIRLYLPLFFSLSISPLRNVLDGPTLYLSFSLSRPALSCIYILIFLLPFRSCYEIKRPMIDERAKINLLYFVDETMYAFHFVPVEYILRYSTRIPVLYTCICSV